MQSSSDGMKAHCVVLCYVFLLLLSPVKALCADFPPPSMDAGGYPAPNTGCLAAGKCHAGIEPIGAHDSPMAVKIYEKGARLGDPNGCVVCHGGNPAEEQDAKKAHTGAPTVVL